MYVEVFHIFTVTFHFFYLIFLHSRNVQELQEQNQRLLEVVRELSDKREEEEQEVTDAK